MPLTNIVQSTNSFVLTALLQYNYFPQEKREREDLPPIFNTVSFTEKAARLLVSSNNKEFNKRMKQGYDAVEYKLTRFNGAARTLSIPHPIAHANLAISIADNWNGFIYTMQNNNSRVLPTFHPDGRILIMDYENKLMRANDIGKLSFGQRYIVRTDISNCFPSIYSHSIPWALVGFKTAKQDRRPQQWFNQIDSTVRATKRNESHGVAVGPGTSHILAEAILARVDEEMSKEFRYIRYVDDYSAYCKSEEEAEAFVLKLTEELAKYKLMVNSAKTTITPLPQSSNANWVISLRNMRPQSNRVSINTVINYMDFAIQLAAMEPDGSVLKYALRTITRIMLTEQNVDTDAFRLLVKYALALSFHHAVLIPLLDRLFVKAYVLENGFTYSEELQELTRHHIHLNHSDAISWLLYYANKFDVPIKKEDAKQIVASGDCIPMLLLYLSGDPTHQRSVISFVRGLAKPPVDPHRLDQYWLLLYQLFQGNKIRNPYNKMNELKGALTSFRVLKSEGVNFVRPPDPLPPIVIV